MNPRTKNRVILGSIVAAGILVSPVLLFFLKAAVGVGLALAALAIMWLAVIHFGPAVSVYFANKGLASLKHAVQENPIEDMENRAAEAEERLNAFNEKLTLFRAAVSLHGGKLRSFEQKHPNDPTLSTFREQQDKMRQLLASREAKYRKSVDNLNAYHVEIDRARAIWDMSVSAAKLSAAAGDLDQSVIDKIRQQTAMDAVEQAMHESFAALDNEVFNEETIEAEAREVSNHHVLEDRSEADRLLDAYSDKPPVRIRRRS